MINMNDTSEAEVGDVDNDGDLDALFANFAQPDQVFMNDGSGNFSSSQSLGSTQAAGLPVTLTCP